MCFALGAAALPWLTAGSLALSAGSTLMQYQAGKAQAAAQNAAAADNQQAALAAKRDTENAINVRQMQETGANRQAIHSSFVDQARRQASVTVSAITSGRSGISVDALVDDIGRMADENRTNLTTNWENTAAQLQLEKQGAQAQYSRQVNSVRQASEPSFLSPLVGIAGAGLRYFADTTRAETAAKV